MKRTDIQILEDIEACAREMVDTFNLAIIDPLEAGFRLEKPLRIMAKYLHELGL